VIAVPAYFNDVQKAAVKEAGELAGLKVRKLVHEPTAVALAYGYNKGGDARVVIVDMGGIRLDVSVMEIAGNVFDVVATGGDPYLGGSEHRRARSPSGSCTNMQEKTRQGPLSDEPRLLQKVRTAAEQAKRELARCKAVDLQIPLSVGTRRPRPRSRNLRLHLATVEELARRRSCTRVLETIRRTLAERNLKVTDIDDVILVGGATRMPLLKTRVEALFGKEARQSIPPEEVVALGAALLADSLRKEKQVQVDVVESAVGIALADGRFMRIIDKDSKLPITRRVMIPTVRDNQKALELDLFEGDAEDILDVEYLGTVVYREIGEAKAGEAKVIVDMALDQDRVLRISSPEPGRDKEVFEFRCEGHKSRKEPNKQRPVFGIAQGVPTGG
jgi:molecular chaperone DnaK